MRQFLWLLLGLILGGCQQSAYGVGSVSGTKEQYAQAWSSRFETYKQQFISADSEIRANSQKVGDAIRTSAIKDWTGLVEPTAKIAADIRAAYTIVGRAETLKRFMSHIQSNPSPGLTEVWFQNEAADWQQNAESIDRKTRDFLDSFSREVQLSPNWMLEMEEIAKEQGMAQGTAQELPSLYQQAVAYFGELRQAEAAEVERQQRISSALFAMSAYYNQVNYQQQLLNVLSRPRTCNALGNTITCF